MNLNKAIKAFLLCAFALVLLSSAVRTRDWYVRPAGSSYGAEDGTSYADAWQGLKSVVWGAGGVEAGDTLYVCGMHLYPRTPRGSYETWVDIAASGNDESSRIIIRGDYPGDKGIIWGSFIIGGVYSTWTDEGSNTYSTRGGNYDVHFIFEDVTPTTWTMLTRAQSLQECRDTPGSYFSETYAYPDPLYIHCSDNGSPVDRIAAPVIGWNIDVNDNQFITFKNIDFYEPMIQGAKRHIRWEGCRLWYAARGIGFRNGSHHIEFINCDRAYGIGGFGFQDYNRPRGVNPPHHMTIRRCTIHDIGIYVQNTDAEGIGTNGVDDLTIEHNEIYNCGTAFQSYPYPDQNNKNIIIRWNYIHDMHQIGGARGTGIAIGMDPPNTSDLSGNQVYGNIVTDCPSKAYSSNYDLHEVVFFHNVAYNCDISFYFNAVYRDYTGPKIILKNNISINPKTLHLYFGSNTGEGNYTIDSDYNLFYPDMTEGFNFKERGYSTHNEDISVWQELAREGCTFDPHSQIAVPMFVDPENGDFHLQFGSPAVDAGIDVGITIDFDGNQVPLGTAPDIGAYEYDPGTPAEQFGIDPSATSLHVYNNIILKENPSVLIACNLAEAGNLSLVVYNSKGKEMLVLCNEHRDAGLHTFEWSGTDSDGKNVGSGIYLVHMKAGKYTETKKIAVVK